MKLIASLTSPYARKVRIALLEKRLDCELIVDIPWEADTHVPDYNPLGKVPVLVADDGEVFYDSSVIVEYLDSVLSQPSLLPPPGLEAVRTRKLAALADGLCDAAVAIFLERKRPPAHQSVEWVSRQQRKIDAALATLERAADDTWLIGGRLSLADIVAGCALGYLDLRLTEIDWRARHPRLHSYFDRLMTRESFLQTMPPSS
ncbi:glutathione S-transferase [Chitinivorax tropicus]|uniref:Glutathione S-transferase n=1 Tax=Chitinivorax tropicus TaxID=714531 RepID=A0A840MPX6_9PROT|nr:glutathione S-transferase [Chitinivorax tropicus]MBB5018526.1 glutathione S-transferase [Chitinivorax tropicus]